MTFTGEFSTPVYVVDDEEAVRDSIHWILSSLGYDVQVFRDGEEFLRVVNPIPPSCIVVDVLLPGMTGLALCRQLADARTTCGVVVISGHGDIDSAVEAMKSEAVDFLQKPFGHERLLHAVNQAVAHAQRQHQEISDEVQIAEQLAALSVREQEIFEYISEGMITKQIAAKLRISSKTVDVHRSRIGRKLRIDSPSQLAHVIYLSKRQQSRIQRNLDQLSARTHSPTAARSERGDRNVAAQPIRSATAVPQGISTTQRSTKEIP